MPKEDTPPKEFISCKNEKELNEALRGIVDFVVKQTHKRNGPK